MAAIVEQFQFEKLATAFAVIYLVFAIRQSLWCWPAALISVVLWAAVDIVAKLYMDFALQIFYFAMSIYGWWEWQRGGERNEGVAVHWWPVRANLTALLAIGLVALGAGLVLSRTDARFPYLDSLTTVAAVLATFMVTRKLMENWIYWFVIDSVYVYIYLQRGLYWFAGLYLVYLVMVVIGFRTWGRSLEARAHGADAHPAV